MTLARPVPCGAQAGYFYRDVIPDAFVVKTQCGRLRHALGSLAMHAEAQTLDRACARYQENRDGDAWMDAYQPLREKLLSRCGAQHCDPKLLDGLGDLNAHWRTERSKPVPSYSMLLFPDATRVSTSAWNDTKQAFLDFGNATGPDHWAIWLADDQVTPNDLDAHERSDQYARKFKLDPRYGPFIVVTAVRPDRWQPGMRILAVRVGGGDAKSSTAIITALRDAIVHDPTLANFDATKTNLQFVDVAQHLLGFARQHSNAISIVKSAIW